MIGPPIEGPDLQYLDRIWRVVYHDCDSFALDELPPHPITQVYGIAFCQRRLLIGRGRRDRWALLGGTPQNGEDWEGTLARKLREEANMCVMSSQPLGFQLLSYGPTSLLQLRAFAIVEPFGPPFDGDPRGGISETKLIDPADYHYWFDWGDVGEHLIRRGTELASSP